MLSYSVFTVSTFVVVHYSSTSAEVSVVVIVMWYLNLKLIYMYVRYYVFFIYFMIIF